METSQFNAVILHQIQMCQDILVRKASEYAKDDDRLHNFHVAAEMQDIHTVEALAGMMAKHTVSIYDLASEFDAVDINMLLWEEKITDHINYLLLLKACVVEAMGASYYQDPLPEEPMPRKKQIIFNTLYEKNTKEEN